MSIFESSTLGTSSNQIVFNDETGNPYFRITRRAATRRDLREFDIPLPEHTGAADYQSFIGKMYFVIEGTMYPDNENSFHSGREALRALASLDIEQGDADSDDGYVTYVFPDANGNRQIHVKVMYVDIPESTRLGLKQPFRLLCKIKYPVIFASSATTATIGDSSATTSGSSNLPWVLPKVIGKTTYSSNGSVTNDGDIGTYPSFVITGPISRPRITNSTTSEYLEVDVNLATASDTLIINYDQDSVDITQAGNTKLDKLTSGSTLFKIRPGTNNLTLTGDTVGSGANATVSIRSAWPLS